MCKFSRCVRSSILWFDGSKTRVNIILVHDGGVNNCDNVTQAGSCTGTATLSGIKIRSKTPVCSFIRRHIFQVCDAVDVFTANRGCSDCQIMSCGCISHRLVFVDIEKYGVLGDFLDLFNPRVQELRLSGGAIGCTALHAIGRPIHPHVADFVAGNLQRSQ